MRRLNRVPLLIAGLMLLLILGAVTYTYQMRLAEIRRKAAESGTRPEPANIETLFEDAPDGGLIPARQTPGPLRPEQKAAPVEKAGPTSPSRLILMPMNGSVTPRSANSSSRCATSG